MKSLNTIIFNVLLIFNIIKWAVSQQPNMLSTADEKLDHNVRLEDLENKRDYWKHQFGKLELPKELLNLISPLTVDQSNILNKLVQTENLMESMGEISNSVCTVAGLYCANIVNTQKYAYPWPDFQGFNQTAFTEQMITTQDRMSWFSEEHLLSNVGDVNALKVPIAKFSSASISRSFLPRSIAKALGSVTEQNIPSIFGKLHIEKDSILGNAMIETSKLCEQLLVTNISSSETSDTQIKACATSFEDTVDFIKALVPEGYNPHNIEVWNSMSYPSTKDDIINNPNLTVESVELKSNQESKIFVNCHSPLFPYRIELCHFMKNVNTYFVTFHSMELNPKPYSTMAFCHKDTKNWNAQHVAFRILGSQPGKLSICHWAEPDDIQIVIDVSRSTT